MKILIIKPNMLRPEDREGHYSSLLLGMLSIASYANTPESLRIAVYPEDMAYISDSIPWADAVGISAFTSEYELARRLVRRLREIYPDKLFFLGGYHGTLAGDCDRELFDFMVVGEGEKPVKDLIDGRRVHRKGDRFSIYSAEAPLTAAEIPPIDYRLYPNRDLVAHRRASLIGSRGCRFHACRFCTSSRFHHGLRRISPAALADQFAQTIAVTQPTGINLWDDNLSDDEEYLSSVAAEFEARSLRPVQVSCFVRMTSRIEPSVFNQLQKLGVTSLVTGLESGSNRVLKYLKGGLSDVSFSKENLIQAREHRQEVLASVMFGSPTETLAEMRETVVLLEWFRDQGIPGTVWVYVASPLPGTPFWKTALRRGKVSNDMNFDRLSFDNYEQPLLLDSEIDRDAFAEIISTARGIAAQINNARPFSSHVSVRAGVFPT